MMEWKLISIGKGIGVEADAFCNAYWHTWKFIWKLAWKLVYMRGVVSMHPRKMNLHNMVNKKYDTNQEAVEVVEELTNNPLKVDFRLLWELHQEFPEYTAGELIGYLEMNGIPMTDAVRKLGICAGILYA